MNRRLKFILAALAVLFAAAMLLRPYVPGDTGQLVALAVWTMLSLLSMIAWGAAWQRAYQRDPDILSGRWAKTKLVLQTVAIYTVCGAGAAAIGYFG